jgi:tetratricopeptide (TPR) repeat protein
MSHPDDWQLREQLARLLQSARQASNAAVQWREIAAAAPAHVVGWYQLGESLAQLGEFNPAREAYLRALSIRPDFVEARLGLGLAEAQAGLTQEALRSFEDILAYAPQHLQARVNHGLVLIKSGQVEAGEADLRKAAAENTNSIIPLVRLAESLSGRKDYPAAAVAYGDAIQRDPRNPALHHRQAIELSRAGWASEADAAFARALQADPNFVSARIDYGVALAQRGQFPAAISEFETVLRQQPTNSLAQTYLKMAQEKLTQAGQPNAPQ